MKRSALSVPPSAREIQRRRREENRKKIEQLEAEYKAQKERAAAQPRPVATSAIPRPPLAPKATATATTTSASPESPVKRRPIIHKDPPTSVETKQHASPASSLSFSQNDSYPQQAPKKTATPMPVAKKDTHKKKVLTEYERRQKNARERRKKQHLYDSSSDDSSSDDCRRRPARKKQQSAATGNVDKAGKKETSKTRRRGRDDSGSDSDDSDKIPAKAAKKTPGTKTALETNRLESDVDGAKESGDKTKEAIGIRSPNDTKHLPGESRLENFEKADEKPRRVSSPSRDLPKKRSRRRSQESSSDSDSSSLPPRRSKPVAQKEKSTSPGFAKQPVKNPLSSKSSSSDDDDDDDSRSNTRTSQPRGRQGRVAHNPIARSKSVDQRPTDEQQRPVYNRKNDGFLSDCSEDEVDDPPRDKSSDSPTKKAGRSRSDSESPLRRMRPVSDSENQVVARNPLALSRASTNAKSAAPSRPAGTGPDELWDDISVAEKKSDKETKKKRQSLKKKLSILDDDSDIDETEMKPEFADPLFGPWTLEPLALEVPELDEEDAQDDESLKDHLAPIRTRCELKPFQVPASIARYLGIYQQEGVKFMFRTIYQNGGGILGDDMGTGKTVQVLALLSALLEKTGTNHDAKKLRRRRKLADEWTAAQELARARAMEQGELYDESLVPVPHHLPAWAPVLILAPSSILDNWRTDSKTWGHFKMAIYESRDKYSGLMEVRTGASEILLVSHKLFEMEGHFKELSEIHWKLVIVDEHHRLKNPIAKMTVNLHELRNTHRVPVLGLTGTVMQNNHKELHCLIDLAAKNLVGDWRSFEAHFSRPIKLARAKDATPAVVELGQERSNELSSLMYKAYLRRTKEEVLQSELPEKDERIVFCELSDLQKRIYQHMLEQPDFLMLRLSAEPCDCGVNRPFFKFLRKMKTKQDKLDFLRQNKREIWKRSACCYRTPIISLNDRSIDPGAVIWKNHHENDEPCPMDRRIKCPYCVLFAAMSRLLKVCNHVALLQPEAHPDSLKGAQRKDAARDLAYAKAFIPEDCLEDLPGKSYIRQNSMMNDHFSLSGKMKALHRLLGRIEAKGGRVLVFSASTQTLDLIEDYIKSRGKSYLRMDGTTERDKRKELADEFRDNHGIPIFLLSTRAMGLGLNLTAANYVIIFDVEWNPSNDSQAQDRAYRLGQTSNVVVFRLVSRGTLEEQKYLRQVYKTQLKNETIVDVDEEQRDVAARLFRGVDGDSSRQGELFGIANLFRFKDGIFFPHGDQSRDSHRYGGGVFNMESLVSAAQAGGEEGLEAIVGGNELEDLVEYAEGLDEDEENEGVQDLVGLTENEFAVAQVAQEEMLGAQSQNMFDLYDNTQANGENDEDEISEGDASAERVVAARFVLPQGSVQLAGETFTSERGAAGAGTGAAGGMRTSANANAVGMQAGMQASAGEPSESNRSRAAFRQRCARTADTSSMPLAEPPSDTHLYWDAEHAEETGLKRAPTAAANALSKNDSWQEARERIVRTWAAAHNLDANAIPGVVTTPDKLPLSSLVPEKDQCSLKNNVGPTASDRAVPSGETVPAPVPSSSAMPLVASNGLEHASDGVTSAVRTLGASPAAVLAATKQELWDADTQVFDPDESVVTENPPPSSNAQVQPAKLEDRSASELQRQTADSTGDDNDDDDDNSDGKQPAEPTTNLQSSESMVGRTRTERVNAAKHKEGTTNGGEARDATLTGGKGDARPTDSESSDRNDSNDSKPQSKGTPLSTTSSSNSGKVKAAAKRANTSPKTFPAKTSPAKTNVNVKTGTPTTSSNRGNGASLTLQLPAGAVIKRKKKRKG